MTNGTITTLANELGWEKNIDRKYKEWIWTNHELVLSQWDDEFQAHILNPATLITLRLKILKAVYGLPRPHKGWEELLGLVMIAGEHILNAEYEQAAEKLAEAIKLLNEKV